MLAPAGLIVAGSAILGWAAWSSLRPPSLPYEQATAPAPAASLTDFSAAGLDIARLERIEIRAPEAGSPIATGIVTRDADQRATPLGWRNAVTEPVFFADIDPADTAKVLAAIREHAPAEAVVFAWWDMSRRIRALAGRRAPLDDPLARGLLTPGAWTVNVAAINENQRAYWGAGVPSGEGETFAKFIDALLMDESRGVAALAEIAGGKEVFVAVHLSDLWKAAAARPDLLSIAYRDFPGGGDTHGVMKAAREWLQENGIEGGFAVEPMGGAIRLHYLPHKTDSARLLARLLPFSTSNPLKLERLELVYQHKGYWIYKLNAIKG
jgi:hydroxylamine oxidation protein HaoB